MAKKTSFRQPRSESLREQILTKIKQSGILTDDEHDYLAGRLQQHYGLLWEDRSEDVETRLRAELPVLVEVPERRILPPSADSETLFEENAPNHILIEGDNLHALSTLAFTHEGKVDVIYIDPPYNTGNKDFRYNDRFVEKEDSYRHSAWLAFMHRRLTLAHRLLKDTGVIFISIDDNEQAQLKLLCDSVFGEGNFVATNVWEKIHSIKNDARYLSVNHEFLLFYAKDVNKIEVNLLGRTDGMNARYTNPDNDPRGSWQSGDLVANETRKDGNYDVFSPTGKVFKFLLVNTGFIHKKICCN